MLRLVTFVCLALAALPLAAQERAAPQALSLHTSFDYYFQRYLEASAAGDSEDAGRMLEEIRRLRVERNTFSLHDLGIAFVYQGFARLESGDLEQARGYFRIASELAPNLPTAYWGLARAAEAEGGLSYLSGISYRIEAQIAALNSARNGPYAGWNLLFLLFTTAMVVMFVFALLILYRYGVLLYHDVEERLGDFLGSQGLLAVTAAILMAPLMVTAGVGWLAPHWLAMTFVYQNVKERAVTILGLLALMAIAPFVGMYADWIHTVSNPLYRSALSSVTGTFDVHDVVELRRAALQNPHDRDLQFLLAAQYKNLGDYELAAAQYRFILNAFPDDVEARVNLGNIYFAQRDWDGALVQYNQALDANPQLAMALYNKSLAHAENFQFAERGDARAQADTIDAVAVQAHEKRIGGYRVVADRRLDDRDILGKFYGLSEGMHESRDAGLSESLLSGWGLRFVIGAAVSGDLIVLLQLMFRERRLTQRCWKCGSAFCGRCQIGTGRKGLCTQCYHLFFMKDGVSAQARNEKLAQVETASTRSALVFRALSILAPGSGHISAGMPLIGVSFLLVWSLGLIAIVFGGFYALPDGVLGLGTGISYPVLGLMGLVLLLANVSSQPMVRG